MASSGDIVSSMSIFDPRKIPKVGSPDVSHYGEEVPLLAHYGEGKPAQTLLGEPTNREAIIITRVENVSPTVDKQA